jgi:hypothetical protein
VLGELHGQQLVECPLCLGREGCVTGPFGEVKLRMVKNSPPTADEGCLRPWQLHELVELGIIGEPPDRL